MLLNNYNHNKDKEEIVVYSIIVANSFLYAVNVVFKISGHRLLRKDNI